MIEELLDQKPKRKWQNLLHKKCPNCDSRLEDKDMYLVCPNPDTNGKHQHCFFIEKQKAADFLLNQDHPANFCLSSHERAKISEVIQSLGITQ